MNDRSNSVRIPTMMAMVVCSAPFLKEFLRELEERGFRGWTLIPKVLGKGGSSDPQMDDDVWPGYSGMVIVHFPPDREGDMRDLLREFNSRISPFKAFMFRGVEEV